MTYGIVLAVLSMCAIIFCTLFFLKNIDTVK